MRPDESCQTARLETWNFDVVTREETHSTYHETLSLHDVYKREKCRWSLHPIKKMFDRHMHHVCNILYNGIKCRKHVMLTMSVALAGWLIHPWWNREKIHHATHGAKSLPWVQDIVLIMSRVQGRLRIVFCYALRSLFLIYFGQIPLSVSPADLKSLKGDSSGWR